MNSVMIATVINTITPLKFTFWIHEPGKYLKENCTQKLVWLSLHEGIVRVNEICPHSNPMLYVTQFAEQSWNSCIYIMVF